MAVNSVVVDFFIFVYYFVILSLRCDYLIVAAVLHVCWLGVLIVLFVVCIGCLFMYVVAIAAGGLRCVA